MVKIECVGPAVQVACEVGGGFGRTAWVLGEFAKKVFVFDVDRVELAIGRTLNPDLCFLATSSLQRLPLPAHCAALVVVGNLLQRVPQSALANTLAELKRVVSQGHLLMVEHCKQGTTNPEADSSENEALVQYQEMLAPWSLVRKWSNYGRGRQGESLSAFLFSKPPAEGVAGLPRSDFTGPEMQANGELSRKEDKQLIAGDYVSPGLQTIIPDTAFPNLAIGDKEACLWPHLRKQIAHNWYVDRRAPLFGFLNRDEASILYNTALRFRGERALEIGCLFGWSACHLALGGLELDVIDPLLENPHAVESILSSFQTAGVLERIHLYPGVSPQAVHELASDGRRWRVFFIDGNHEHPGPLLDAEVCQRYAAEDALMLFHDLASPDVARALDYLRDLGWNTLVYQTMQVMAVAWRGNVHPVKHIPDPNICWPVPGHLRNYAFSG